MKTIFSILFAAVLVVSLPAAGTVSVPTGGGATLTVTADGTQPFTYQWQKNGVDVYAAKSASLYITAMTADKAGVYRCKVSNSAGSTISDEVTVTYVVIQPPTNAVATGTPK